VSRLRTSPLPIGLLLLLSLSLNAQIHGTVSANDGRPVAGADAYGSRSNHGVGPEENTTTDESGHFRLANPGAVLHVHEQGLAQRTVVLKAGESEVNVVLEPLTTAKITPVCDKPRPGFKRFGGGYGVQFDIPKTTARIQEGTPDVDYVRHLIKRKGGKSALELWFGVYAMNLNPDDDQLINSVEFKQQSIVSSNGSEIGLDSWGHLHDGSAWRQIFVSGSGARYKKATPEDATFFNQILDTFCEVP
jgi:hypothetical protein